MVDDRCLAEHPLWYCIMLDEIWGEQERKQRIAEEMEKRVGW